jgi:deoxynucleoside triphosphate triphosphohydrolase SAMHD1
MSSSTASKRLFAAAGISQTQETPGSQSPELKRPKQFHLKQLKYSDTTNTNDECHHTIKICPVMKAIIDTPHFQRLRGLKQLGTAEYLYMNADHNRFQHSVGVAHLANLMVTKLKEKQPNLQITDKDVLCVTLAGLLHDIGHGPFSHVYDGVFPKQLKEHLRKHPSLGRHYSGLPGKPKGWVHEDGSNMMIDAMLEYLGLAIDMDHLDDPLRQIGSGVAAESLRVFYNPVHSSEDNNKSSDVMTSRDWIFIKEAIQGKSLDKPSSLANQPRDSSGFIGRPHIHKEFLYDIVSNRHNYLDVDKIDYYARDERRTLKGNGEIDRRLIEECVVAWGECPQPKKCFRCRVHQEQRQHLMIAWPVKCATTVANFFHQRFRNHSKIYQHKTTQAATYMVADIMTSADPYYRIKVVDDIDNSKPVYPDGLPISLAMIDPDYYLRLKDSIIDKIEDTVKPELQKSRLLIRRLRERDLYKCVATKKIRSRNAVDQQIFQKKEEDIAKEIICQKGVHDDKYGQVVSVTEDDFIVEKASLHLGAKEKNPVSLCRFVDKGQLFKVTKEDINELPEATQVDEDHYETHLPRSFIERSIRVYCRNPEKVDLLSHLFDQWLSQYEDGAGRIDQTEADDEEENSSDDPYCIPMSQEIEMSQDGFEDKPPPPDALSPIPTSKKNGRLFDHIGRR